MPAGGGEAAKRAERAERAARDLLDAVGEDLAGAVLALTAEVRRRQGEKPAPQSEEPGRPER